MKTLYLHIGTPKTASSAIQEFCRDNSAILEKRGYCYPPFFSTAPYNPQWREAVNGAFLKDPEKMEKNMPEIGVLFQKYDNIILSEEQLWRYIYEKRKTLWEELLRWGEQYGFCVKAIVYLRRQDSLIESWWNQSIKGNEYKKSLPWESYIANVKENQQLDYYDALERISAVIGKENVIVHRFGRDYFPNGNIQEDFLNILGLELTDEYALKQKDVNTKLDGNTHELKRVLNVMPGMDLRYNAYFRDVLSLCSDQSGRRYPNAMFSPEEARAFVLKYEEGNQKVVREYLHEENASLFDMTFKDIPKWESDNPYMYEDIIRFVGETNIKLLRELDKVNSELEDMKDKLKHPFRTVWRRLFGRRAAGK